QTQETAPDTAPSRPADADEIPVDVEALPGGARGALEAVLMVADAPIPAERLAATLDLPATQVRDLLEEVSDEDRGGLGGRPPRPGRRWGAGRGPARPAPRRRPGPGCPPPRSRRNGWPRPWPCPRHGSVTCWRSCPTSTAANSGAGRGASSCAAARTAGGSTP